MQGLGKLMAMLNPLDQSAVEQLGKAFGKASGIKKAMGYIGAGAKQILSGGYFKGHTLAYGGGRFRSKIIGDFGSGAARRALAENIGRTRGIVAGLGGAWAGLNILAPHSNVTGLANTAGFIGGTIALGQGPIQDRFGTKGRNILYGGAGAFGAARLFGIL